MEDGTLARRPFLRICPSCGEDGMILWLGGYTGTLYKCPSCEYIGPIVIEEEGPETDDEVRQYSARLSRVNRTLNWAGLLFGLSFMALGLVVGFSPLPLRDGQVGSYGLGVFTLGTVLVIASGLFWIIDRSRTSDKGS